MTINYGKREPGGLTASNPGDTLYIPFGTYNDSGNSEALTGLAVGDIEIFKNGDVTPRATDSGYSLLTDTGQYGDRAGIYRVRVQIYNTADDTGFFDAGSQYHVAIDSILADGRTVRFFPAVFEVGRQRVDIREILGDTGAATWLKATFASGFTDTGLNERLARIQSDVDTGIRVHIDDSDTGIKAVLALADTGKIATAVWAGDTGLRDLITDSKNELDTGIKAVLALQDTGKIATAVWAGDTGLRDHITNVDTGIMARFDDLAEDTGGVNINAIAGDTGAAGWLKAAFLNGFADTGLYSRLDKLSEDTGGVNINSIQGDTGAAAWLKATFAQGFTDTGLNERLARIQSDVDTGLRIHIDDSDTGLKDTIADLDTGIRALLALQDTGAIATAVWAGDTGLRDHITNVDTGIMARFDDLAEDTGGVIVVAISDTGLNERLDAIEAQTAKLTFDTGNEILSDVRKVNSVTVQGTGSPGDEWRP